ncbi:heterokaryon incompatibility protein, partial [Thelonectria olida]
MAMSRPNDLCATCRRAFTILSGHSSHESYEAFREASQKCFICYTVWNFTQHHAQVWEAFPAEEWHSSDFFERGIEHEMTNSVRVVGAFKDPISRTQRRFDFYFTPTTKNELGNSLKVDRETSSASTLELAHKWLQTCCSSHDKCGKSASTSSHWHPTRLVDIGVDGDTEWTLCVVSEDGISPSVPYLTLSYRWGFTHSLKLLTSNMDNFRRGNPIRDLPRTFSDFVTVARSFSIRYVWIDSLCIIQDSVRDWQIESATMGDVFSKSVFTVAASASRDPDGGLFRERDPAFIQPGVVKAKFAKFAQGEFHVLDSTYWERNIFDGTLHTRGWVFQERMLSARILYFTKHQVMWECRTEHKCEAFPQRIPYHSSIKGRYAVVGDYELASPSQPGSLRHSTDTYHLWNELVSQYSACHLTKASDKLIAFHGIAQFHRSLTGDEYVAGMWKSRLRQHMNWTVLKPLARPTESIAPSWSWASVGGEVQTPGYGHDTVFPFEILDVCRESREGRVSDITWEGYLQLSGVLMPAICESVDEPFRILNFSTHTTTIWFRRDSLGTLVVKGETVWCLLLRVESSHSPASPGNE